MTRIRNMNSNRYRTPGQTRAVDQSRRPEQIPDQGQEQGAGAGAHGKPEQEQITVHIRPVTTAAVYLYV